MEAKDYAGCVQTQLNGLQKSDGKRRWERDTGDFIVFDPQSVRAIRVNGKYGRYLEYRYAIQGIQEGRAGYSSPGVQLPSTFQTTMVGNYAYTTMTPGPTVGAFSIPGRPGGPFSSSWKVEADCVNYTANWDGDSEGWRSLKGDLKDEPASSKEAKQILDEFCPQMPRLVQDAEGKSSS